MLLTPCVLADMADEVILQRGCDAEPMAAVVVRNAAEAERICNGAVAVGVARAGAGPEPHAERGGCDAQCGAGVDGKWTV